MRKRNALFISLLLIVILASVLITVTSCTSSETVTYVSSIAAYKVGDTFDENAYVSIVKNGKEKQISVTEDMVTGFTTEKCVGNAIATITYGKKKTLDFNYFVTMDVVVPEDNGTTTYTDLVYGDRSCNKFDMYLPTTLGELSSNTKVMLFVHGGAWVASDKTEEADSVDALVPTIANNGYVVVTMEYGLGSLSGSGNTIETMFSDIGIMVAYLKYFLPEIGVDASKIAIAGYSAGAQLAGYYAYTTIGVSPIEIGFYLDCVGPVYISDPTYKDAFGKMKTTSPKLIKSVSKAICYIVGVQQMDLSTASESELNSVWERLTTLSPITYVSINSCPTILAYGGGKGEEGYFTTTENDSFIPVSNSTALSSKLEESEVQHICKVFDGLEHMEVGTDSTSKAWIVEQVNNYFSLYI